MIVNENRRDRDAAVLRPDGARLAAQEPQGGDAQAPRLAHHIRAPDQWVRFHSSSERLKLEGIPRVWDCLFVSDPFESSTPTGLKKHRAFLAAVPILEKGVGAFNLGVWLQQLKEITVRDWQCFSAFYPLNLTVVPKSLRPLANNIMATTFLVIMSVLAYGSGGPGAL